jgi:hypothetical protein
MIGGDGQVEATRARKSVMDLKIEILSDHVKLIQFLDYLSILGSISYNKGFGHVCSSRTATWNVTQNFWAYTLASLSSTDNTAALHTTSQKH